MRYVDRFRAVLGATLLLRPALASRAVGEPPTGASDVVTRILAVRMLAQVLAGRLGGGSASARRRLALADSGVEALHGASMLVLAIVLPHRRRLALASGGVAAGCVVADAVAAGRSGAAPSARPTQGAAR